MDILSDDSDSFFEDPKKLKAKKATLQSKNKKSVSVQNLFGISDEKPTIPESSIKSAANKDVDWLGLGEDVKKPSETVSRSSIATPSTSTSKLAKKISFEDDDDLLGGLGLDRTSKKSVEEKDFTAKKSAILEDLLGSSSKLNETKIASFDDILQSSRAKKETLLGAVETKDLPASTSLKSKLENSISTDYAPSTAGRRSRHGTTVNVTDPLGIFASTSEQDPEKPPPASFPSRPSSVDRLSPKKMLNQRSISLDLDSEPKPTPVSQPKLKDIKAASSPNLGLPNWLGGASPSIKTNKSEQIIPQPTEITPETDETVHYVNPNYPKTSQESLWKLSSGNLDYQSAQITLQQQESQVLMALQVKKYEDNLAEVQRSQMDLISKQERQFNELLERQFVKQQVMENNMRLQQERINNHIQLLISQPSVSAERLSDGERRKEELKQEIVETAAEEYKEIVNNLKQKHHEEMFLMEESYK